MNRSLSRFTASLSALRSGRLVAIGLVLLVAACASRTPAPVEERSTAPRRAPSPAAGAPSSAIAGKPGATVESDTRASTYTVKRGDTLYLIALDHGLDYKELAAWNNIANVDRIFVGQVLRLAPPGASAAVPATPPGSAADAGNAAAGVVTTPLRTVPPVTAGGPGPVAGAAGTEPAKGAAVATTSAPSTPLTSAQAGRNTDTYKSQPKAIKEPYSEHALREMQRAASSAPTTSAPGNATAGAAANAAVPAPPTQSPPIVATAPPSLPSTTPSTPSAPAASAPPVAPADSKGADDEENLGWVWPATGKIVTGFSDNANLKGIDIAGKAGQPVLASAAGKVVYAGSGLRGYGKLIIIKHNKSYLSAYAHNKEILVKEGQQVTRGQKIAEMGNTDTDQYKLHFEIRRLGKPMDPLKYLPPA